MALTANTKRRNIGNALTGGIYGKGIGSAFEPGATGGDRLKTILTGGILSSQGESVGERAKSLFSGGLFGAGGLFTGEKDANNPGGVKDPLGARLNISQNLLEQYINSAEGQRSNGGILRGARVFQANDRPGYSPDEGVTDAYAAFYNWVKADQERLAQHEQYVTLAQDQPGRQATILGSASQGNASKTVLGSAF